MNKKTEVCLKVTIIIIVMMFVALLLIKRFVYFKPTSCFVASQEKYQDINHLNLHGWFLEHPQSDKVVLLCHGNSGNVSHREKKSLDLYSLGLSVLVFDYSGFGKSKGVPNEQQLYDDASSMLALLRQRYHTNQIILYGESMGAPVATYVAVKYSIPILLLESPLPSIKLIIKHRYPYLSWFGVFFPEFNMAKYLEFYRGKSLLMHSKTDHIIPYDTIHGLINLCTKHIVIEGVHADPVLPLAEIAEFISTQ